MMKFPIEVTKGGETATVHYAIDLKQWEAQGWKVKTNSSKEAGSNKTSSLQSATKEALLHLATKHQIEGISSTMKKDEIIAILESRIS